MKSVLTIAGSDSGGGAGIQADLKTFTALGVFGTSAITAVTAQNTLGVWGVFVLPKEFVGQQIDSVMADINPRVWKIGMLSSREIIDVVADKIKQYNIKKVVLDPVMVAKSGDLLLQKEARMALIKRLIPLSYVVTPNLYEAQVITGHKIGSLLEMKKTAKILYSMGSKNVIVKGGHLASRFATDIFYNGKVFQEFKVLFIKTQNTHGTGCTFSSAIAVQLALGYNLFTAVGRAKKYVTEAIKSAKKLKVGKGHGPLNHMWNI